MSVIKFDRDFSTLFNWDTDENPTTEQDYQNAVKNWTETEMNIVDTLLWQPTTEYATGNIVKTPSLPSQYVLRCTEAGTSGSTEPSYSGASVGDSVTDGTVEWVIVSLATGNAADVDASNIGVNAEVDNSEAWASAIGGGAIAEDDGRLVTGDTVYAVTSELASDIATNTEAIGDNTEAIATNTANIEASAVKIDIDDKRISNIEKLLQGQLYDYQTDTDSKYTKTVPDGAMPYASLNEVGGKTVVWNQLVDTSATLYAGGVTYSVADDVYTVASLIDSSAQKYLRFVEASNLIQNHVYLGVADILADNSDYYVYVQFVMGSGNSALSDETSLRVTDTANYVRSYTLGRLTNTTTGFVVRLANTAPQGNGGKVKNVQLFDLTLMFGAGNEPTTVQEFTAQFPADYYAYNQGSLLSAGVTEVVSQGRNLYDNANAVIRYGFLSSSELPTGQTRFASSSSACCLALEVKPNTQYTLAKKVSVGGKVIFGVFDHIPADQEIGSSQQVTYQTVGEYTYYTFTTPQTAKYLLWYYFNRNDGGSTEAQIRETAMLTYGNTVYPYTPYTETSYPIPAEIRSLEGYGWSAGSVFNYIDYERKKFVKCVDRVNLGTLGWSAYLTSHPICVFRSSTTLANAKLTTGSGNIWSNVVCSKYIGSSYNNMVLEPQADKVLTILWASSNAPGRLILNDSAYDSTQASALISSLSGQYLYYELATPQEIDISAYITDDNLIEVEAGGTLTFPNSNGDDYRIPVPSAETYMVDLQASL